MDASEPAAPSAGRPRTFDTNHVVEVAVESYWADGVEGVSINEICRRAGVSKPGLYREFGGEDGLMDAALQRYAETVLAPNFEGDSEGALFVDVLDAAIDVVVDIERSGPLGCLHANMRQAPDRLGPQTRKRVQAIREHAKSTYAMWVERAKHGGEMPLTISTDIAVALIDFQLTNVLVQMSIGEDPDLLRAQAKLSFVGLLTAASD